MDTRDGAIHLMNPGETMPDFAKRHKPSDFVPVARVAPAACPKCKGTGSLRRGLFSKRFKPCGCVL